MFPTCLTISFQFQPCLLCSCVSMETIEIKENTNNRLEVHVVQLPRCNSASASASAEEKRKPVKMECLATTPEFRSFHCMASESLRVPCIDDDGRCKIWAGTGECQKNAQYMLVHCRKSCSSCIPLHPGEEPQIASSESTRSEVLKRLYETQEYLHKQADRNVETLKRCVNKHSECTHWWSIGECDTNSQFMHTECSPACQTCQKMFV